MNTSRIILAFLLCFSLAACGGGNHENQTNSVTRECAADLAGSFDTACAVTVYVPTSGAASVMVLGTLRIENSGDIPRPYARTVYVSISGGAFATQMLHGIVPAHSGMEVPFALVQPLLAGMFPAGESVRVGLSSIDHDATSVVHGVVVSAF